MNEIDFRNWLERNGKNRKVISDNVSRLKRIERELGRCDIDEEYRRDQCRSLLLSFSGKCGSEAVKSYDVSGLPASTHHISRYAINLYVKFRNDTKHAAENAAGNDAEKSPE